MGEFTEKIIEPRTEDGPKPRRVFVEVGTNRNPVPVVGERKFGKEDIYIGIDLSEDQVKDAAFMAVADGPEEEREDRKKNLIFMSADAKTLPLQEKSVDELYFGNFFGDSNIVPGDFGGPASKATETIESFLNEASRVLKDKGKVIIKENNSPASLRFLQGIFQRKGFVVKKFVRLEDKDWSKESAPYDKSSIMAQNPHPDSYILELEKNPAPKQ